MELKRQEDRNIPAAVGITKLFIPFPLILIDFTKIKMMNCTYLNEGVIT
jgi:hypothetical protein